MTTKPEQHSPSPFPDDVVEGMAKVICKARKPWCADREDHCRLGCLATPHGLEVSGALDIARAALAFLQKHYREVLREQIERAYSYAVYNSSIDSVMAVSNEARDYAAARLKEIFG